MDDLDAAFDSVLFLEQEFAAAGRSNGLEGIAHLTQEYRLMFAAVSKLAGHQRRRQRLAKARRSGAHLDVKLDSTEDFSLDWRLGQYSSPYLKGNSTDYCVRRF